MEVNGWNEWSMHVLKELERLNDNYESLRNVNEEIKSDLSKVATIRTDIDEIKLWRSRVDDVLSPAQMKDLSDEVQKLSTFKTVAVTTWAVVQTVTMLAFGIIKLF